MSTKPVVIITPVGRYLGFSAPESPIKQFTEAAEKLGVVIAFKDPQKIYILQATKIVCRSFTILMVKLSVVRISCSCMIILIEI